MDMAGQCRSARAQAYAECGRILAGLGREEDAAQTFAKAVSIDENQRVVQIEYGLLLKSLGRGREAANHFCQAMYYDQSYWCLPRVGRDAAHPLFLQERASQHG